MQHYYDSKGSSVKNLKKEKKKAYQKSTLIPVYCYSDVTFPFAN